MEKFILGSQHTVSKYNRQRWSRGHKARGHGQRHKKSEAKDRNARGQDQGHKCKCFSTKKGFKNFFSVVLQQKNDLEKHFSADLQNFNHSKNRAVLEPRTGQFSRIRGFEAKDFKMCPRGRLRGQGRPRGLHL